MRKLRKQNQLFYFTVEGETEHWYLKWLENTVNSMPSALYTVKIDCPVLKDPMNNINKKIISSGSSAS